MVSIVIVSEIDSSVFKERQPLTTVLDFSKRTLLEECLVMD